MDNMNIRTDKRANQKIKWTAIGKLLIFAAVLLLPVGCVKDDLYNTPHPDKGAVKVTTDWSGRSLDAVLPDSYVLPTDNTQGMELEFHLLGGETYRWAVNKAENSKKFNAGSKYVYTITIGNPDLEVTSTIEDWTPGNGDGESGSAQ